MIVHQADLARFLILPTKDDSPLGIDPNAVGAAQVTLQRLKPVPGRPPEIVEFSGGVQEVELQEHLDHEHGRKATGARGLPTVKQILRGAIGERGDHADCMITGLGGYG